MITFEINVICDGVNGLDCNNGHFTTCPVEAFNVNEAMKQSLQEGWSFRVEPDGTIKNLCPHCVQRDLIARRAKTEAPSPSPLTAAEHNQFPKGRW